MAVAKTLSIYVNGVDLAKAFTSFNLSAVLEEVDCTTLNKSSRTYEPGFKSANVQGTGVFAYDATNADEIHDILSAAYDGATTLVITQSFGAISVGAPAQMIDAQNNGYSLSMPLGALITVSANMRATQTADFGKWLFNAEVDTTTTNGTSVDNSAATSNGGLFHVHYQGGSGTEDLTAKIQHSTDNSTWVDLGTITATNVASQGGQSLEIAAGTTVRRYIRAQIAVAQGALTVQAAFARR